MGKSKKNKDEKVPKIMIELNVSMHCNACERNVAKAISKVKGVEKFITDMPRNRVVIYGKFKPEKIEKKIKKKTGKRIRILVCEKEEDKEDDSDDKLKESTDCHETSNQMYMESLGFDSQICSMFNDENANACSVM